MTRSTYNTCAVYLYLMFGTTLTEVNIGLSSSDYTCDQFPDYPAYIEQWHKITAQISSRLYPYGTVYCDQEVTREDEIQALVGFDPNIQFSVPYFGKLYNSLWVSPSGFIALSSGRPATPVPFIWFDTLPNPQYPTDGVLDPPMFAPFYAEANMLRNPPEPSAIYYRVLDPSRAPTGNERMIMEGMLWDISTEIRASVVGGDNFQALYGIVVTWHQITFLGNDCSSVCARNTYQTAVVTDGLSTFAVYSYQNMTWVGGGANQNCDRLSGTKTYTSSSCKPGHAGFNAGDGRWFQALPYSNQDQLSNIDIGGGPGSNVTGRYYYKVSADKAVRGGCTNDTSIAGPRWQAEVFPQSGTMLGGSTVNVSGPCFNSRDRLKCRFDSIVVDAVYVNNIMRVMCIAPSMGLVGPIKIGVSVDGGNSFPFETEYIIVTNDHVAPAVQISRQYNDWLSPGHIELIWTPQHLTPRPGDRVDIKLFGYREEDSSGTPMAVWEELQTFAADYSNTGVFSFDPMGSFVCKYDQEGQKCTLFDIGAFQINIRDESQDPINPRRIWSQVFPLGWYIKEAMIQNQGDNWISYKCQLWYNNNYRDVYWLNELDPCPCTFAQAYADFGRYQPDPQCFSGNTQPTNCERHPNVDQCVLSVYASSSGSGNQCCYDASGLLVYSGDTPYGSIPQRSHVWGAVPYRLPPRIPQLSHWQWDLTGFYYCCQWQQAQEDCYRSYLDLRHTKSCENYQTPGQALAFGDPHYQTFDGVFYTFNGYGEFWLMQVLEATVHGEIVNFKLQARFEQPANQSWGETKATYMTAVGMQLNDGHKVVVELNKRSFQKKLLVHVNDYLLDLTPDDLRRQELEDFIIINNDPVNSVDATNFTVVYRCGLGINAVYKNDLIDLVVSAPPEFKDHTRGLLGKWNGDPSDDLDPQIPLGPIVDPGETENVHNYFGLTWMVTNAESCFQYLYRAQLNHDYYNRYYFVPNYSPKFPPNNTDVTEDMVINLCGTDKACTFDYKTTLSADVGQDSLDIQKWDQERREMGQPVISCGWLNVPYSTKANPISYLEGSQVTITGCISGYTLEGPTQYICQNSGGVGVWSPEVTTRCRGPDDPLSTATILAISIPVALVAVLLVIGITVLVIVLRRRKKKQRQSDAAKQVYVPIFQEIIEWKRTIETASDRILPPNETRVNKDERKQCAQSREGLADVINNEPNGQFTVVAPSPERKQKPPRPEPHMPECDYPDIFGMATHQYDSQMMHSSDESGKVSSGTGNHVSWDMRDEDDHGSEPQPAQVSTLKSNKTKVSMDPLPKPSPTTPKKKRQYQYPVESRTNSQEDFTSQEDVNVNVQSQKEPIATYRPRDVHSYTKGHNIPTYDGKASDYYTRKYGRYGAGYQP